VKQPLKPDAAWARLLEQGLPDEPRAGAEERVLAGVRERLARDTRQRQRVAFGARRWYPAFALAALAVTIGVAVWRWPSSDETAREQRAALTNPSESSGAVDSGTSERELMLGDGVRLLLRDATRLRWQESSAGSECWLERGSVLVHVPERYGRRFVVRTTSTEVVVTGTVFGVEQRGELASVTVWHGSVEIKRASEQARVGAGQHWPREARSLVASAHDLERIGALERVRATAARANDSADAGVTPEATLGATARPAPAPPVPSLAALSERYREARALEARGERARASELYAVVASSTGAEAEAATFAAARLRHGLGQQEAARRLLESYRHRFPQGSYARAVDVLLLRVQLARGDGAAVEREATRFLDSYPRDPRAAQFRWARAKTWAESGRCREAIAERSLLDTPQAREIARLCDD
jgi:hypothetical protein